MGEERCVCCGKIIPEGKQICKKCEQETFYQKPTFGLNLNQNEMYKIKTNEYNK